MYRSSTTVFSSRSKPVTNILKHTIYTPLSYPAKSKTPKFNKKPFGDHTQHVIISNRILIKDHYQIPDIIVAFTINQRCPYKNE